MVRETVDVTELANRLAELLTLVSEGGEVTVLKGEHPVARLVPMAGSAPARIPGLHAGAAWISDDFDDPLPESFWAGDE